MTDKIKLGAEARRLLDDPVLQLAFDGVERSLIGNWCNSLVGQHEQREEAYRMRWALLEVKSKLHTFLNDAKMIKAEAEWREKNIRRVA